MYKIIFLFLAVTVLISCGNNSGGDESKTLLSVDSSFSEMSIKEGAAEAFNFYLADSALELPSGNMPVQGRKNIYDQMKPDQDSYILEWKPQQAEVAKSGELGYTWGFYTVTYQDSAGSDHQGEGKYLNIWKKDSEGNWKVLIDMGNKNQ